MADGRILKSGLPRDLVEDVDVKRLYLGERFSL
jgi:ABC-type lipopolysaccharide export system ATPase subunit